MSSVSAALALVRWPNALMAAAGVVVGALWGGPAIPTPGLLAAALAAMALTAAANAWNDVADVEIDRIAHPRRPLPRGALSSRAASRIAWACAGAAVPLAALTRWELALLTLPVLAVMWGYSPWLKSRGLPGNIAVAVLASLPLLYGAWTVGAPAAGLRLAALAAPLHLARELAKDLDDAHADAAARRTLAVRAAGQARAMLLAALLGFLALAAPLAAARPVFALALLPAIFVCALAARRALVGRGGGPALLKLAMLCAMAALLVARAPHG